MAHIITVPAFSDNYIWLICDEKNKKAAIVDPGDASPVIAELQQRNIQPVAILITHFHSDHVGGIDKLLQTYPGLTVYGPATERIPRMDHPVTESDEFKIDDLGVTFKIMDVHGHTAGHIAYYFIEQDGQGRLFCGDTLFGVGCGRVFNGTLQDLHDSLQKIAALPSDTLIYCAHEYTLDNIGFAKWVEPDNADLLAREQSDRALIDNDQATVPSTLALELKTNPFLRTDLPHVVKQVAQATGKTLHDSADVFAAMRTWKDTAYD